MAASCSKSGIPAGGTPVPASPNCNLSRTPAVSLFSLPRSGTWHALSLGCSADRHSASGFAGAEDNERFVRCFRQAWPYIRGHSGSTFVVVISGEIVDSPYLDGILRDISLLHGLGIRFVIVPGTHVLIDKLLEEKGSQGKYVGRFRITDSKSLEAAMEVAGRICLAIESKLSPGPPILSLRRHGGSHHWHELGVSVTSGNFLAAKRRGVVGGIDFGSTGEVKRIDVRRIQEWLDKECIVIVSNLGYSSAGEVLNCNDIYEGTRSARTGDIPGIRKVIQPLEDSGVLIHRNIEELLKQLGSFIVVERDGSVIACAALIPFFEDNYGEIAAIAVSPECRGQGKGDKLLDFIEKKALSLGLDKLFLLTTCAADWFVRRGFTECSIESIPSERKKSINISRGSKCYMKKLQMPLRKRNQRPQKHASKRQQQQSAAKLQEEQEHSKNPNQLIW